MNPTIFRLIQWVPPHDRHLGSFSREALAAKAGERFIAKQVGIAHLREAGWYRQPSGARALDYGRLHVEVVPEPLDAEMLTDADVVRVR